LTDVMTIVIHNIGSTSSKS